MDDTTEYSADHRHVFISYRRQDGASADGLENALRGRHRTWRDTQRIRGGQDWREAIVRAIDRAYALLLIVSPATEHSKEVYAEYFYALGRQVPVIPVVIEACDLPFGLGNVNARIWQRAREQCIADLLEDLDRYRQAAPTSTAGDHLDTYLGSLRLAYLMNVGTYTPMLGKVSRQQSRPVEMQSRFSLRRTSVLYQTGEIREEVRDHAELLPALHERRQVALLGEPGIGKTMTLFKFADELSTHCATDPKAPIPVILPLREWKGSTTIESFIRSRLGSLDADYASLRSRLHLLCDGLNELDRDTFRDAKVRALKALCNDGMRCVVTCRALDYRDPDLRLDIDTIEIHPLEPSRILHFLERYLIDDRGDVEGAAAAETLFWQIAGGDAVQTVWRIWRDAGADLDLFFRASEIPQSDPDVYSHTSIADDRIWTTQVDTPANLIHLAANPYLLWMFLGVHAALGKIPDNRGGLFDEFVFGLLGREGLTTGGAPDSTGRHLITALEDLAWALQQQAVADGESNAGMELTLARDAAIEHLGDEAWLYRAASANLLEDADPVRFTHQLLQEYFAARRLLGEIAQGLPVTALWPERQWWQASGWEETVVLAAGTSQKAASQVFDWVAPGNPEVAAACIRRSGARYIDEQRLVLRSLWLDRLTDNNRQAEAARAAIGRALGSVSLSSGEPLDNRPGIGLRDDGVPDIAWVPIDPGEIDLEDNAGRRHVDAFEIGRYPITCRQFQAFIDAADGYANAARWTGLEREEPAPSAWTEANGPRETVSWYEAVAFSRWLSKRLGYEVRLPDEFEWQQAATAGKRQAYPWGDDWQEGYCNSAESGLNRTTAVGLYRHGTWPGGPLDMAGNVWEWCLNKYRTPEDHQIDLSGDSRVMRGGAWDVGSGGCRAAYRSGCHPGDRLVDVGFRLVRPPSSGR